MKHISAAILLIMLLAAVVGCGGNDHKSEQKEAKGRVIYRGLYSFGPEVKSFKNCETGQEFWAADSSATLELKYSQLIIEKPYEPVYVEVEGEKIKSGPDGEASEFDSTIVVKKLIKITKEIPAGMCDN
ncbi:hypothetical protein [Mucilaginibacter myungsuensis]|uniref:NlpE C-terminal OB domain-containing protein n=1 Tax=Mucilaginibacter myungsuensis TaxID=649104 RepID=A0A929L0S2_9SPHI|nr:hypothetical protein [Mucilaginibacter myungsuensis]MBE9664018.1 hypothetical protein [Mucilaginibacter myungsuensis]MDN3601197.1 hypothetical protein [Mucilaginibacter myungsuensis]